MPDLRTRMGAIRTAVSEERAFGFLHRLWEHDRWSTFTEYEHAAQTCAEELEAAGLSGVELVPFPADGKTLFGEWRMPIAWECDKAVLEIVAPPLPIHQRILAQYSDVPSSLVMWSAPTPEAGVEGELVVLSSGKPDECVPERVHGRIVLTPGHPRDIKVAAADAGALGIVSSYTATPALRNTVQWVNTWSDRPGGWAMHADDRQVWAFMVSPERGEWLRELAQTRGPVRLRAVVRSRFYEGQLHYVTGLLPAQSAEQPEEVLLTAHINEQGANDNASGTTGIAEAMRVLADLVKRGEVPPPRRSIRALFFPESYGLMAYVCRESERLGRTVAAINVDGGAGPWTHAGTRMVIYPSAACCPNAADALVCGVVREYYRRHGAPQSFDIEKYTLSGDNFLCEPLIGVPHPWLAMGWGERRWHNSADAPETIDPKALGHLAAIVACCAEAVADLGEEEAELACAELALQTGNVAGHLTRRAIAEQRSPTVSLRGQALAAAEWFYGAYNHLAGYAPHEQQIQGRIRRAREAALHMLRCLAQSLPDEAEGLPDFGALGTCVPRRELPGALTLDSVPFEKWRVVESSPRWWSPALSAWWWATGQYTIDEIAYRVALEFGHCPNWLGDFFAFLKDAGLIALGPINP